MTARDLYAAFRENVVRRLFRGVYVDAAVPDSREVRIRAIKLVSPPHAVVCDSSAAWLYGVDTFRPSDRFLMIPSLVVPHGATRVTRPDATCREAYIDPSDILEVDSLLVTTPLRTTVDLMRKLWRPYALAAADGMVRSELVEIGQICEYVRPLRKLPGIVQAKQLMQFVDPGAESPGESWTRLRLLDAGFPRPETQISITDKDGREIARLDMGYADRLIAVEYDGREFHTADDDRLHDEERRSYLGNALGWRFEPADVASVLGDDPALERRVGKLLDIEPRLPRAW